MCAMASSLPEVVPLLAALLLVSARRALSAAYPEVRSDSRQKTLEALLAVLLASAAQQPVCVVLEDLHWGDPSTLEFLTLLIDQVPTTCLLVLSLARPDFHPLWASVPT